MGSDCISSGSLLVFSPLSKLEIKDIYLSLIGSDVHRSRNRVKDRWTQSHLFLTNLPAKPYAAFPHPNNVTHKI